MHPSQPLPVPLATHPARSTKLVQRAAGALLVGLLIGAVVALVAGWTRDEPPATVITDTELALAYRLSETEATSETKGKRATIRGRLSSVGKGEDGQAYVGLARGHVRAYVRADHLTRANDLSEGTPITMNCLVEGRDAVTTSVVARDCTIDEVAR